MNFSELYVNNKRDVEKKIATLWGGEAHTASQRAQVEKLKEQSRQTPQPAPAPEKKSVPGYCFEREITGW